MLDRLLKIKELRGKFANGGELSRYLLTDAALKNEINALSKHFFGKSVSGCSNCYFDTLINLILLDMEKAKQKTECSFELRRGALLRDNDISKNITQANITDELARYHWKKNPHCRKFFTKVPDDLKEKAPDEFLPAELEIIEGIKDMLTAGEMKTNIGAKFAQTEIEGKKITGKRLGELIKAAETPKA